MKASPPEPRIVVEPARRDVAPWWLWAFAIGALLLAIALIAYAFAEAVTR